MIDTTIGQWKQWGHAPHFKQRRFSYKFWNNLRSLTDLEVLRAIAMVIFMAEGGFVSLVDILQVGRQVDTSRSYLRADCSDGRSSRLHNWVWCQLYPAVQSYTYHEGDESHSQQRVFMYAAPRTRNALSNLKASHYELNAGLNKQSLKSALRGVDARDYMQFLPDNASKKVWEPHILLNHLRLVAS